MKCSVCEQEIIDWEKIVKEYEANNPGIRVGNAVAVHDLCLIEELKA